MKTLQNLLTLAGATAVILVIFGFVAKVYWSLFMFGWGVMP